jgi:hypothetical protein
VCFGVFSRVQSYKNVKCNQTCTGPLINYLIPACIRGDIFLVSIAASAN